MTGLGLSIARTLVEQMHGTISARYEDDKLYIDIFFGNNLAATTCRHGYDFAIFVQVSRRDAFYLKKAVTVSKGERAVIKGISFPMLLVGLAAFYTGNVRHHAHPK